MKPFSQACENNKGPILAILNRVFAGCHRVLEIGSGTGQHAVHFAHRLPHLEWQTSDREENLSGINAWIDEAPSPNLRRPLALDVTQQGWPHGPYDGIFTANTCHIMAWPEVQAMFAGIRRVANKPCTLAVYGPFRYSGQYTSESNARFDQHLKSIAPHQGLRELEQIVHLAETAGFRFDEDNAMPANNQLLVFHRPSSPMEDHEQYAGGDGTSDAPG